MLSRNRAGDGKGLEIQLQRQFDRHQRAAQQRADNRAIATDAGRPAHACGANRQALELRSPHSRMSDGRTTP